MAVHLIFYIIAIADSFGLIIINLRVYQCITEFYHGQTINIVECNFTVKIITLCEELIVNLTGHLIAYS